MPTIIKGSTRTLRLHLTKNKEPLDLTGATAVRVIFKGEDQLVQRTFALSQVTIVSPAGAGLIDIKMDKIFTESLKVGERQDFEVELTIGTSTIIIRIQEILTVEPRLES